MKRRWRIAGILILGLWLWDLERFVNLIFTETPESVESVDLVAVLTGGKGRLKEALHSFIAGRGEYLLISGTGGSSGFSDILRANKIDDFPDNLRARVIIDSNSMTTTDNVHEIVRILDEKKLNSVKVITSNYHLPRTMKLLNLEMARQLRDIGALKIYRLPVESPNFPIGHWWRQPVSWQILLSEYFKYRATF